MLKGFGAGGAFMHWLIFSSLRLSRGGCAFAHFTVGAAAA